MTIEELTTCAGPPWTPESECAVGRCAHEGDLRATSCARVGGASWWAGWPRSPSVSGPRRHRAFRPFFVEPGCEIFSRPNERAWYRKNRPLPQPVARVIFARHERGGWTAQSHNLHLEPG